MIVPMIVGTMIVAKLLPSIVQLLHSCIDTFVTCRYALMLRAMSLMSLHNVPIVTL